MAATFDDFQLYLGVDSLDWERAVFLIGQAESLCLSVVDPLPDAADVIVLSAAARAYSNPQGVTSEGVGPYNVQRPWAGIYLTKAERAALRRMVGSGGAFSINPTPASAGPKNVWPQIPTSPLDTSTNPPYYGDWDWPPS